jgi:cytochrome c oxidase subunit 2
MRPRERLRQLQDRSRRALPRRVHPLLVLLAVALAAQLTGCGGRSPSTLDPHGPSSSRVAGLWWLLFWIALAVFVLVSLLIVVALVRRRGSDVVPRRRGGEWMVVAGGVVLPALVLSAVWGVGLRDMSLLGNDRGDDLTVQVIGHEWWWEVRYPAEGVVTANEIHVPAGQRVRFELSTADVIHSFWVPQLGPKTDLIAGQVNVSSLEARQPGIYRGQCAEYCGLQHANMAVLVVAEPRPAFDRWLDGQRQAVARPSDPVAARGLDTLVRSSCAGCHTLKGTTANGKVGPDLTHFGSRRTLGAGVLPNTRGNQGGWTINSQAIKPGNHMPPQQLTAEQLQAVLRYFETQR